MAIILFFTHFSPDFNPIETVFGNIKGWCRRHAAVYREAGLDDEQILDLAIQSTADSVDATIMSNKYDLTDRSAKNASNPIDDLADEDVEDEDDV
jgi:hypothetical protein